MKKNILKSALVLATLSLIVSCNNSKKETYVSMNQNTVSPESHPGKKLLENKCYVCHNPTTDHDSRIAPPMVAVKSHYLTDNTSKEEFQNAIWNFVKQPSEDKTKMRGAVRRFGLMPYQPFIEEEIKQIADYMYDYKIDEPDWFKEHIETESKGKMKYRNGGINTKQSENVSPKTLEERGLLYALSTKKELGKNLMGTIQKKGTLEALNFCNKKAYPITDSMAKAQNATIKRVSDKPRNHQNQANSRELAIINQFKTDIANNITSKPVIEVQNNVVNFYYPITTNSMCLQCHGSTKSDVKPDVLKSIVALYPSDKATGYGVEEVRGIWSITYPK